jgi:ubiquitin-like protein Pup
MAEFKQAHKAERARGDSETQDLGKLAVDAATSERNEKLKAELDELLDDIDEVLEVNAEDFVKSYVQKGGE